MSKNKNVKIEKKKVKRFNWGAILFYLKSLINNSVCKEIGVRHWIISIFIFLLSIFITSLPVLTTEATKEGSRAINQRQNDILVEALRDYVEDTESIDLKIANHKMLTLEDTSTTLIHTYTRDNPTSSTDYRLDIYFFNTDNGSDFNTQLEQAKTNNPSLQSGIYFGSDVFYINLVSPSTMQAVAAVNGGYSHIEDIVSFKEYLKEGVTDDLLFNEKNAQYLSNFCTFVDKGYLEIRGRSVGIYTGIVLGVNAGITLIVVLIFFLLTRNKNNPNRQLKFYHIMGVAFMSTLSPAILAMIVGYIMGGTFTYIAVLYVMLYGFRAMYMTMKYLRPPMQ